MFWEGFKQFLHAIYAHRIEFGVCVCVYMCVCVFPFKSS